MELGKGEGFRKDIFQEDKPQTDSVWGRSGADAADLDTGLAGLHLRLLRARFRWPASAAAVERDDEGFQTGLGQAGVQGTKFKRKHIEGRRGVSCSLSKLRGCAALATEPHQSKGSHPKSHLGAIGAEPVHPQILTFSRVGHVSLCC